MKTRIEKMKTGRMIEDWTMVEHLNGDVDEIKLSVPEILGVKITRVDHPAVALDKRKGRGRRKNK